jgi:hypothetical protein
VAADPRSGMPADRTTGKNESGFLWDKRLRWSGTSRFKLWASAHDLFAKPLTLWRIMRYSVFERSGYRFA